MRAKERGIGIFGRAVTVATRVPEFATLSATRCMATVAASFPKEVSEEFDKKIELAKAAGSIKSIPVDSALARNASELLEVLIKRAESGCEESREFLSALKEYATDPCCSAVFISGAPVSSKDSAAYFAGTVARMSGLEILKDPQVDTLFTVASSRWGTAAQDAELIPHVDQPGKEGLEAFGLVALESKGEVSTYIVEANKIVARLLEIEGGEKYAAALSQKIFKFVVPGITNYGDEFSILTQDKDGNWNINFDADLEGLKCDFSKSPVHSEETIKKAVQALGDVLFDLVKSGEISTFNLKTGDMLLVGNHRSMHGRGNIELGIKRELLRVYFAEEKDPKFMKRLSEFELNQSSKIEESSVIKPKGAEALASSEAKHERR